MSEKRVVGVSYEPGEPAPVVMLKASGAEADAIESEARSGGAVPVVCDPALVKELYRVPMDRPINKELFPVMAALLVHVLRLDRTEEERV